MPSLSVKETTNSNFHPTYRRPPTECEGCIHTHIKIYTNIQRHTHILSLSLTHTHTYTRARTHTRTRIHVNTHTHYTYTRAYTRAHTHAHANIHPCILLRSLTLFLASFFFGMLQLTAGKLGVDMLNVMEYSYISPSEVSFNSIEGDVSL